MSELLEAYFQDQLVNNNWCYCELATYRSEMTPTRLDVIFRDWEGTIGTMGKRQIWKGQNMTRSLVDYIDGRLWSKCQPWQTSVLTRHAACAVTWPGTKNEVMSITYTWPCANICGALIEIFISSDLFAYWCSNFSSELLLEAGKSDAKALPSNFKAE